jgi:hypothetical protein
MYRLIGNAALALVTLAAGPGGAVEIVGQIEASYELSLDETTLPASLAGTVIFRPCESCNRTSLQVNAATRYVIDGSALSFDEFKARAAAILATPATASRAAIYLHYDLDNNYVTRMRLSSGSR